MAEQWTVETLKVHYDALFVGLEKLMDERDARYMQKFEANDNAVELAKTALSVPKTDVATAKVQTIAIWAIVVPFIIIGLTGAAGLVFYLVTKH